MSQKLKYTTEQFRKAIVRSGGVIGVIAARVGCSWHTAKKYIDKFPTLRDAYDNELQFTNDIALSVVLQAIKEGDIGTAKWWLTKKRPLEFGDQQVPPVEQRGVEDLTVIAEMIRAAHETSGTDRP